jgi:hypothetical protein
MVTKETQPRVKSTATTAHTEAVLLYRPSGVRVELQVASHTGFTVLYKTFSVLSLEKKRRCRCGMKYAFPCFYLQRYHGMADQFHVV